MAQLNATDSLRQGLGRCRLSHTKARFGQHDTTFFITATAVTKEIVGHGDAIADIAAA
jgi:hypothetical protein